MVLVEKVAILGSKDADIWTGFVTRNSHMQKFSVYFVRVMIS